MCVKNDLSIQFNVNKFWFIDRIICFKSLGKKILIDLIFKTVKCFYL